jgi:hypothetical protein
MIRRFESRRIDNLAVQFETQMEILEGKNMSGEATVFLCYCFIKGKRKEIHT